MQATWTPFEPTPLRVFEDVRGRSFELFRWDVPMGYASWTRPGVVRGPHQHKYQSEILVMPGVGCFEFYIWRNGDASTGCWCRAERGAVFVPALWVHAYKNVSDVDALLLVFPDTLYRGENQDGPEDIIKWENVFDSPYELPDFSGA